MKMRTFINGRINAIKHIIWCIKNKKNIKQERMFIGYMEVDEKAFKKVFESIFRNAVEKEVKKL